MAERTDYFSRSIGRVDVELLTRSFVVVFGIGSVGSAMALELARSGVGHMVLVDGDRLEVGNLSRHALPDSYVSANKAEAMASHLSINVPGLDVGAVSGHVDDSFDDLDVDRLIAPADLVIVATDQRESQRRLARRALAMDIPAIVPGLYADRGGEVFAQLTPGEACFTCWDDFRDPQESVRGATSINADALSVIQHAVYTSLALLDPRSRHARELAPGRGDPRPRQLFQIHPGAALVRSTVTRRPGCAGCAVGPSPLSGDRRGGIATSTRRVARAGGRPQAAGWPLVLTGDPTPPVFARVEVGQPVVLEGQSVRLSWEVENAVRVRIEGLGEHPPTGALEHVVTETTSFRLTAVNPFGETSALSPTVRTVQLPRLTEIPIPAPLPSWPVEPESDPPPSMGPVTDAEAPPAPARPLRELTPASLRASTFASAPAIRTITGISPPLRPHVAPVTFGVSAAVQSMREVLRMRRQA